MIACAYTPGRYEELARQCVASWRARGLEVQAVGYEDAGSWHRNVLGFNIAIAPLWVEAEPLFVIGVDTLPAPWADARALQREMERLTGILARDDVVCEYRPSARPNMKIHSGIVGWADSAIARATFARFVDVLNAESQLPPHRNDQEILYELLLDMEQRGGSWHRLRDGYNCKNLSDPLALFVHGHASRRADVA